MKPYWTLNSHPHYDHHDIPGFRLSSGRQNHLKMRGITLQTRPGTSGRASATPRAQIKRETHQTVSLNIVVTVHGSSITARFNVHAGARCIHSVSLAKLQSRNCMRRDSSIYSARVASQQASLLYARGSQHMHARASPDHL